MFQKTGVLYARVSSKEQEKEGFSIPAQLKFGRNYGASKGISILKEFVDVETAKQAGRTDFGNMVSFLKKNPSCRIVICEKTDRLYRNIPDWVILDNLGLEVHFFKENVIISNESKSSEKFIHGIKVLMAKNYVDNLSEETKKGMVEKAEEGYWPSFAPLGYINTVGANGIKTIIQDKEVAPLVALVFEKYATGLYSIKEVTVMAQKAGMIFRKSGAPVATVTVHKMLRNRIYTGDFDWNGKTYSGKGKFEPIVTRELWLRVQEILDNRFNKRHRKVKHNFAFSGLIECGHCGCSLVGEIKKGRYVYYHCTGFKVKCPDPYVREEVLEARFVEVLERIALSENVMNWVREALFDSYVDEKRFHDEAVSRLKAEHTRYQNRIDTMYIDKLDGKIDADFFDRKAAEWRLEQSRILSAIEDHDKANQTYLKEGVQLLELTQRASILFRKQNPSEKRQLLNFVLSNCIWKENALKVNFKQPFETIAEYIVKSNDKRAVGVAANGSFENWLPRPDSNQRPDG